MKTGRKGEAFSAYMQNSYGCLSFDFEELARIYSQSTCYLGHDLLINIKE